MKNDFTILIVDDEIEYQRAFSFILTSNGYQVLTCSNGQEALENLSRNPVDLVMTDLKMPGMDGMELVQRVKDIYPDIEIMIITAFGTIESAVQAMKHGATGYFIKSSDPSTLLLDINRMAKIKKLEKTNQILRQQNGTGSAPFLDSKNPEFRRLLEMCRKAADSGINVLLLGESGVGKEVLAQYIHRLSDRRDQPFIPVNCQVFADSMVESELFGHEKGAFTGADQRRVGRFEAANHGTLFLDEIGDLPVSTQGKLLRTLENKTVERIGSNQPIDLDIRLISATNKDLNREIADGVFREDLLYRINTLTLTIPPLRDRQEDISDLIQYFLHQIQLEQKKKILTIEPDTLDFLLHYSYPGNIRELKNILERMVALSENGVLRRCDEGIYISEQKISPPTGDIPPLPLRDARAKFEKDYIEKILHTVNGNVSKASQLLGITSRQLWNKISEYDIEKHSQ